MISDAKERRILPRRSKSSNWVESGSNSIAHATRAKTIECSSAKRLPCSNSAAVFQRIGSNTILLCPQWGLRQQLEYSLSACAGNLFSIQIHITNTNTNNQIKIYKYKCYGGRPPVPSWEAFFIAIFARTTFATLQ